MSFHSFHHFTTNKILTKTQVHQDGPNYNFENPKTQPSDMISLKQNIQQLFFQESSYHDLKAAMVSSMEEFFRVVSVSIIMRRMREIMRIGIGITVSNVLCFRNGSAHDGPPMPTLKTPTAICESIPSDFSVFQHDFTLFSGTSRSCMTTSGIELTDGI